MPRPLTRRRLRQTFKTATSNGLSIRTRLAVAALIPALLVPTVGVQTIDALETTQTVIRDNHFITDDSGAKHAFGIHNLQVSTYSGGRFAAGTVGSVGWTLWAKGSSPPIQVPTIRIGQRVVTTVILPPGFEVLTASDLSAHREWDAGVTPCDGTCTVHTNADGSSIVRLSKPYTGGVSFWSSVGKVTLPVRAVRAEPRSTSVHAHVQFPNPEESSAPDHADAPIPWAPNATASRSFGLYGNGIKDYIGRPSLFVLPNHPGANNYWPRARKGRIAFDLQPTNELHPVSVQPGDTITFNIGNFGRSADAWNSHGLHYDPTPEAGFPVTDACTTAPAGWAVESCWSNFGTAERTIVWKRVGTATSNAFAQPYRVELPATRGDLDSEGLSNQQPSIRMTVALSDEAISNNVYLYGGLQAEPATETTLGVHNAQITNDAGTPGLSPGQTGLLSIEPQIDSGIPMPLAKGKWLSYTFRLPAGLAPGNLPKGEDTPDWYDSWGASGSDTISYNFAARNDLPDALGDREKLSVPVVATDALAPGQTVEVSINLRYPYVSSSPTGSVTVPVQTVPGPPSPSTTPEPTPSPETSEPEPTVGGEPSDECPTPSSVDGAVSSEGAAGACQTPSEPPTPDPAETPDPAVTPEPGSGADVGAPPEPAPDAVPCSRNRAGSADTIAVPVDATPSCTN